MVLISGNDKSVPAHLVTMARCDLPREELESAQRGACPTCGACQFMGSASTGQVLVEAPGLAR